MVITIYASAAEKIAKKLDRLSKKASAYGCELSYSIGTPYPHKITSSEVACGVVIERPAIVVEAVDVDVCYDSMIACHGWQVIAHIEHGAEGNIVTAFGCEPKKEWYSIPSYCDHCGTNRKRKATYIVENDEGECRQVGKSCLKDYTGINPAAVVAAEEVRISLANESVCNPVYDGDFERTEGMLETESVLAIAVDSIRDNGYVRVSEEHSTKDDVLRRIAEHRTPSKEAQETAKKIMLWLSTVDEVGIVQDCKSLSLSGYCKVKHLGRLAYMPVAYDKRFGAGRCSSGSKGSNSDSSSEYVGTEGERLTFSADSAKLLTSWGTAYGITYLYRFVSNGNIFVWFASREIEVRDGMIIRGTVKSHSTRDGIKQTVLTRCKAL